MGSPFNGVPQPSVTVLGRDTPANVLYTTGPIDQERGWPVFGIGSSVVQFGQPWTTGPAVPFSTTATWRIEEIRIGAFGPGPVTGVSERENLHIQLYGADPVGDVPGGRPSMTASSAGSTAPPSTASPWAAFP